jgi:RHS repeat-associated protein
MAIAFARDGRGRVARASLSEATGVEHVTAFERDAFGRVVCERQGDRAMRYAYDAQGRRTRRAMPDGATTHYAYDPLGELTEIDHDGHRLRFARDLLGREAMTTSGDHGLSLHHRYDVMDRLIEQRASMSLPGEPTALVARRWQHDERGRVTGIDDARWGATRYGYDAKDRLLSAERGRIREVFGYDPAGAINQMLTELDAPQRNASFDDFFGEDFSLTKAQPSWTLGPSGRVLRTARVAYAYDAKGRRTGKRVVGPLPSLMEPPGKGKGAEAKETRYTWDAFDRLREVTLPDGALVVMTYDAFGRRIRKEVTAAGTAGSVRPEVTVFVWDGDVLAADHTRDRGVRTFVHRPSSFEPLLQQEGGQFLTYVNDHLGTPKELLTARGLVAWAASHGAWGQVTEEWRDALLEITGARKVSSPFRLLGQYADLETGLCYTRFRYFDPEVGGWCSPDPLGLLGGLRPFGFDGSPTLVVDPLGLERQPWKLTPARSDATKIIGGRTYYRHDATQLWWSRDTAGHGGSAFKVYEEQGDVLVWVRDATIYGDYIDPEKKHKGPKGKRCR